MIYKSRFKSFLVIYYLDLNPFMVISPNTGKNSIEKLRSSILIRLKSERILVVATRFFCETW